MTPISGEFLAALRSWGDNTVFDRATKENMLRRFTQEAKRFQPQHDWLYRGHCIDVEDFDRLMRGESIQIDLGGSLSSWTTDSDVAHTFARFAGCDVAIVVMKQDLRTFFDFEQFGEALRRTGGFPHREDYPLHDPIREQEVLVEHPSIMEISQDDVLEAFGFDQDGRQAHWHF